MFHVKEKMSISCYILLLLLLCSSKIVYSTRVFTGAVCGNDQDCYSYRCDMQSHKCLCGNQVGSNCNYKADCCGDAVCLHKVGKVMGCCSDSSKKLSIEEAGKVSIQPAWDCLDDTQHCDYDCHCCSARCNGKCY